MLSMVDEPEIDKPLIHNEKTVLTLKYEMGFHHLHTTGVN